MRALWVMDHLGMPGGVIHGATRYFLNVLPRLRPDRVKITLCFLGPHHPVEAELRSRGIEPLFFDRARWDPRALRDVWKLAHETRPHIMHLGGMKSMIIGRVVARTVGARAVIHLHDINHTPLPVTLMHRLLAPWTDLALGVSADAARHAAEVFHVPPARCVALPNGVPVEEFSHVPTLDRAAARRSLGVAPDARVVLVMGRLYPVKSQDLLVAHMPRIRQRVPNATLLLVGHGPTRAALEAQAKALGQLGTGVIFTGQYLDLPGALAAADLLALPTRTGEGLPMAALEAMSAARPVVAFRNGGMPEVVSHNETGLLAPPGNDDALADAVADLLADPARCAALGAAAAAAVQRFSIDEHVRTLQRLYDELVGSQEVPQTLADAVAA